MSNDEVNAIIKGAVVVPKKKQRGIRKLDQMRVDPTTSEVVIYNGLTESQELYCKLRAESFSVTQSYKRAYPNDKYPAQNGYVLERKPAIEERIKILLKERATAASLVSPEESLARWNFLYHVCMQNNDIKGMMEAQKQIDKINGAESAIVKQQIEMRSIFAGEQEEWKGTAEALLKIINATSQSKPKKVEEPLIASDSLIDTEEDEFNEEEDNE